jgi:mRNA-degrading endonuclease toxin of MazEF toxin-antitoxin module
MRGSIYFVRMPEHDTRQAHSCERGYRPVVVVSSNIGNRTSNIVMVCPLTTRVKSLSCNVDVNWSADGRPSQVLCNQIVTIPKSELVCKRGQVSLEEQRRIDIAMCISLGIRVNFEAVGNYDYKRERDDRDC